MNPLDRIIGRGLIAGESLAGEFLRKLSRKLRRSDLLNPRAILAAVRAVLAEIEPEFTSIIAVPQLAAWVIGTKKIADALPEYTKMQLAKWSGPPGTPPSRIAFGDFFEGNNPPIVKFPKIEQAANSLQRRGILLPQDYYAADVAVRANAFTMSGNVTENLISRVRDVLETQVRDGASLAGFQRAMEGELERSALGPRHLETVFRTNVQTAYSDGQEALASNPVVAAVFPYQEYYATHDARTRPEHLALEKLGINGTNVYRSDDPMWGFFTPPWGFNCRCAKNPLTIRAAADRGVKEAQLWLRTGRDPASPQWRIDAIPFRPTPGWGSRRKLVAA